MRRLEAALELLPSGVVLADIGCDHGKLCFDALETRKATKVYACDISAPSLEKARKALKGLNAEFVCCDGLDGLKETPDCVLIAGMGGEEILHILRNLPLPRTFVLQPMKNADKVRAFLVDRGAKLTADYTFFDGKYYDLIVGENEGGGSYTDWEIEFGRDNLLRPSNDFAGKLLREKTELANLLQSRNLSRKTREEILERKKRTEAILNAIEPDI